MRKITGLLVTVVLLGTLFAAPGAAAKNDVQGLNDFVTGDPIGNGAHTSVQRGGDSVSVSAASRQLTPGYAYTVWLVIFNTPDGCNDGCGEDDLENPNANPSVMWSGIGGYANGGGNLNGHGGADTANSARAQILFGPGLVDPAGAEIHFVVRDHGPATGNPSQTTTFEGECTPGSSFGLGSGNYECFDPQFSIHIA